MILIYNLFIQLYTLGVTLAASFGNAKAQKWVQGRKYLPTPPNPLVFDYWFHCASVGEFEQARPLIEKYRTLEPNARILLTFFSPSGYELRKNYALVDTVCYLPIDTPKKIALFLAHYQPKVVFFIKYEFWYHLLKALHHKGVAVYLVSAHFAKTRQILRIKGFYRKIFNFYTHIFVQTEKDKAFLVQNFNLKNVSIAGDTRFDRVLQNAELAYEDELIKTFIKDAFVVVAGSVWLPDIVLLAPLLKSSNLPKLKIIFAPHEINTKLMQSPEGIFYTQKEQYSHESIVTARVLWIDTIGLLSKLYRFGHCAYIGGGFGAGIHNTLEAAVYGKMLFWGPNYQRFQEAKDLIEQGAAMRISHITDLMPILHNLYQAWRKGETLPGNLNQQYVVSKAGATNKVFQYVNHNPIPR